MRLKSVATCAALCFMAAGSIAAQPVISALQVDGVTENTATISFSTDVPTLADYWIVPVGGPTERIRMDNDGVYRTNHTVVLDTLYLESAPNSRKYRPAAGLDYQYAVIVTDASSATAGDSSGANTFTTTARPNDAVIDGWLTADVGTATMPGYTRFDNSDSTFYVFSAGTSLFNKKDEHHYIYKAVSGNFDLTFHITGYAGVLPTNAKGAALFRASLANDSEIYSQSVNYKDPEVLYYRLTPNTQHVEVLRTELQPNVGDPIWIRLKREGNDFTVWYSLDGTSWTIHGPATVNAAVPLSGLAGFAGMGHFPGYYGEIGANNMTLTEPADVTAPVLSNVDATPVNNTATIDYDANEWVTTILEYGLTTGYGTTVNTNTLHVTNSIELTGLEFEEEYHFRIKAYDSDANEVILSDMTFMTEPEEPLAVELAGFSGKIVSDREVQLLWTILSSDGIARFDVEQRTPNGFATVETVDPTGDAGSYEVRLRNLEYGAQNFRLRIVEVDGTVSYSSNVELLLEVPGGYSISEVYPNPFESAASFTLTVKESQPVTVEVFNLAGQRVDVLFDGMLEAAAPHRFEFDGSGLAGGVYFYRARGASFVATDKMVLVK